MSDCLFCKIVAGEIPSKKVYDGERVFAFEDIHPQAPVHVLVVPKKHVVNLFDGRDDPALLGELAARAATIAHERGLNDFRLVSSSGREAGQAVFHLHFHVLGGRRMGWPPG
jgi:histidine triad (HIT) family protein